MEELYHYGVKGMKWGVRRYQNKDGSYTPLGRLHKNNLATYNSTESGVRDLVKTLTKKEKQFLTGEKRPSEEYLKKEDVPALSKRFVKRKNGEIVSFLDVYKQPDGSGAISIATKNGKEFRGKGYSSELVKKAQKWLDSDEARKVLNISYLAWGADPKNLASIELAKKWLFELSDDDWGGYVPLKYYGRRKE